MGSERFDIFRQVIAFSTADSWSRAPHVAYGWEGDATALLAWREGLQGRIRKGRDSPPKITLNTILMLMVAKGLKAAPNLNAHLDYRAFSTTGRLMPRPHVDMTIPWLLPDGKVISVVVPGVEDRDLAGLQDTMNDLGRRIAASDLEEVLKVTALEDTWRRIRSGNGHGFRRAVSAFLGLNRPRLLRGGARRRYYAIPEAERLSSRDVDSGSVVVSNIGSLAKGLTGRFQLLDLIEPMVFAVGIGALQDAPRAVTGPGGVKAVESRPVIPFCLVFDHRALEFSALLPFIARLEELFARPELLEGGGTEDEAGS
jgi:pyruvate dehydrogenase E2 component (dihydrolipoamide acetyltransferase)